MKAQREMGGLLELTGSSEESLKSSSIYNEDLKPVPLAERTWNVWNIATLWIGMAVCVPTYALASGLISAGMNWWQAILTVFLGNAVVLIPMALIAFAGTKYGIPYPIFCRSSFGFRGAHLPALLRAGVACGWFGIQCWIGGQFLNVALTQSFDFWKNMDRQWFYAFSPKQDSAKVKEAATAAHLAWDQGVVESKRLLAEVTRLEKEQSPELEAAKSALTAAQTAARQQQARASESRRYLISLGMGISFFLFWLINVWIGYKGTESIKWMESWGAPILIGVGAILMSWAIWLAGGIGPLFAATSLIKRPESASFMAIFLPSLNGMIAFWATLALNIPDFTRYARSQKDQVWGQIIGMPTTMGFYAFVGVCGTLGSIIAFGEAIWEPSELLSRFNLPILSIIGGFAIFLATITTNIAANVVAPSNAFSNLAPRLITYRIGVIATGLAGLLIQPWKLLAHPDQYIFGWLGTYGSFLGPLAGVYLADYYLIRKQRLNLHDLYLTGKGRYHYFWGVNWRAIIAYGLSVLPFMLSLLIDLGGLGRIIQNNSWTVGLLLACGFYYLLMKSDRESVLTAEEFHEITETSYDRIHMTA